MIEELPSTEIQLELLRTQRQQCINTAFVHRSQAKAFANAQLVEEAKTAAKEQAKWERILESYDQQIKELTTKVN